MRQGGADDLYGADGVGLELLVYLFVGDLFRRAEQGVSRVIDDYVDTTEVLKGAV